MGTAPAQADLVTIDEEAASVITDHLADQGYDPNTAGLRIAVEHGGCAGKSYRFSLTDTPAEADIVCDNGGATVFVDAESAEYLDGADITVETTAHGTGFVIDNPNAEQECGCGLSFT